jgi:hypothetical protein
MVAEWGKPINSPSFEESGMLPSNTAPQPGNIEARKTISGIPEHPDKTVQARTQRKDKPLQFPAQSQQILAKASLDHSN